MDTNTVVKASLIVLWIVIAAPIMLALYVFISFLY